MRLLPLVLALIACKTASSPRGTGAGNDDITEHTALAEDDGGEPPPAYSTADVEKALIAERGAEASAEHKVAELEAGDDQDAWRVAHSDLAVRRRFIAVLEVCQATNQYCPPRLDDPAWPYAVDSESDPKLDVPLRFDATSWQKVAAELHGRACACRTLTCVDSMDATIERLEKRPTEDVRDDETAAIELTRARDCLFRLRGKRALPHLASD